MRFTNSISAVWLCSLSLAGAAIMPAFRTGQWRGNVGVSGGIPSVSTVYATLYASNATAASISSALAACPSNQVVLLSAGTYSLSDTITITKSGVVLRGSGMSNTILRFSGVVYGNIFVSGRNLPKANEGYVDALVNWTNNFSQGETNLVVNTASNIVAGDIVVLDQVNDGGSVQSYGYEGLNTGSRDGGTRSQQQIVEVISVVGTTLTVWPPVMMPNWSLSQTPQIWKPSSGWNDWVKRVGFEDFSVDGTSAANYDPYAANIFLFGATDCWVSNVMSLNPKVSHVNPFGAFRCEVRHSYFYGSQSAASMSYGIVPVVSGSCLFEDNIFNKCAGPMLEASCSQGNVWAYNYVTNVYYTAGDNILMAGAATHDAHTTMDLWEGNHMPKWMGDFAHGSGGYHTLFRNRLTGYAEWTYPSGASTKYLTAVAADITNHFINVVGNVLGTTGVHTNYEWISTDDPSKYYCFDANAAVYALGLVNGGYSGTWNADALVENTIFRHANWDSATSGRLYNATNADHTLPDSLFRVSKPAYFGSLTWPPFNPTNVTAAALSPTNLPAGYRFVYGADPTIRSMDVGYTKVGTLRIQ